MEFEWDPVKDIENRRKHGITFEEAETVFDDDLGNAFPDPDHSFDEERFLIVGNSSKLRLLIVSYAERSGVYRIISARPLTRAERRQYEASIKRPN